MFFLKMMIGFLMVIGLLLWFRWKIAYWYGWHKGYKDAEEDLHVESKDDNY